MSRLRRIPAVWRDPVAWTLIVAAALLIFASLGPRCLWQDEAETAPPESTSGQHA